MEDRETTRMHKYGESKTTRIMMATVPHVTSGLGLRTFQADGFLLTRVFKSTTKSQRNAITCDCCPQIKASSLLRTVRVFERRTAR